MVQNYESIVRGAVRRRRIRQFIALMSAIVLVLTTAGLRHKADTMTHMVMCGYPDHEHNRECYDEAGNSICTRHVHSKNCYEYDEQAEEIIDEPVEDISIECIEAEVPCDIISEPVEEVAAFELSDIPLEEYIAMDEGMISEESAANEDEFVYQVGDQQVFFLSDVIKDTDIDLDDVAEVGQVVYDDDTPILVQATPIENDYEIKLLSGFDLTELAITLPDNIAIVKLVGADYIPESPPRDDVEPEADGKTGFQHVEEEVLSEDGALGDDQSVEEPPVEELHDEDIQEIEEQQPDGEIQGEVGQAEEYLNETGTLSEEINDILTFTVDLTEVRPPLSLNSLLAQAMAAEPDDRIELEIPDEAISPLEERSQDDTAEMALYYDEALISITEAYGDHLITPIAAFDETKISAQGIELTLINNRRAFLDLGLAVITAPNMPADTSGHAILLTGDEAEAAASLARQFSTPRGLKKAPRRSGSDRYWTSALRARRRSPVTSTSVCPILCAARISISIHSLSAKGTEGVMKRCAIAGRYCLLYCNSRVCTLQNPWR